VIQLKSPTYLKLGRNVGFGEKMIMAKKLGQNILFPSSQGDPDQKWQFVTNLECLISCLWFSISTRRKAM